jgi:hypothetical protein
MTNVVQLRDYHLKRLEQKATDVLAEVLPLADFAKHGGPIIANVDPWAGCHCPDGVDGLLYESSVGWVMSET